MPPASSQKGTGKKGAGAIARQRSRNTTPSSVPPPASLPPIDVKQTEYLDLNYDSFRNLTYEDVVDQNAISSGMPESKNLDGMMTRLQRLQETLERRHNFCDRGMRLLVPLLRARLDDERSREEERLRREAAEDDERARKANKANKANKKKRKAADSLAPHDTNVGQSSMFLPLAPPPHHPVLTRSFALLAILVSRKETEWDSCLSFPRRLQLFVRERLQISLPGIFFLPLHQPTPVIWIALSHLPST